MQTWADTSKQIPSRRYQRSQVKELPGPSASETQLPSSGSGGLFHSLRMDSVLFDEFCFQVETHVLDLSSGPVSPGAPRVLIKKSDAGLPWWRSG